MAENITSIKKMTGTRFIKGKRPPHSIGKIRHVVFYPDQLRVAGFITKQIDFLLMFKRKGHFISIDGYYMYENYAFVRRTKGAADRQAYKKMGLDREDFIEWLGLSIVTESGQEVGVVADVAFVHQDGRVVSIESGQKAVGKIVQGTRTIPVALVKGYRREGALTQALAQSPVGPSNTSRNDTSITKTGTRAIIVVSDEAYAIDVDNEKALVAKAGKKATNIARNAGVDTTAVSEKAKTAAAVAGSLATDGAVATAKQLKKTRGMFSAFKDEFDKALHDDK